MLTCFTSSPTLDPSVSAMSSDKTHEMLEEENDQLMDEMAHKIHTLKTVSTNTLYVKLRVRYMVCVGFQLSIDIGDEVKGQNRFLGNMVSHLLSFHTPSFLVYRTTAILRMRNLIQQVASLQAV